MDKTDGKKNYTTGFKMRAMDIIIMITGTRYFSGKIGVECHNFLLKKTPCATIRECSTITNKTVIDYLPIFSKKKILCKVLFLQKVPALTLVTFNC